MDLNRCDVIGVSPGHSIEDDETAIEEDLLNQSRTCGGKVYFSSLKIRLDQIDSI